MKASLVLAPALIGVLVGSGTAPRAPERGAPLAGSLEAAVDAALAHGDLSTAVRTVEVARRRAKRDLRWEPSIEIGDAYYRISSRAGAPEPASRRAREAYQNALRNARHAESLDGVLRAAEGFAQLGDVEAMELSLHVARDLAGSDAEALDDLKAATGRLSDLLRVARPAGHDDN
jgi:hypothetical protein